MQEAMKLMMSGCEDIQVNELSAKYCYAMSLQTCADIVKNGFLQKQHILLLEFMEMIGRVAFIYYASETDVPLFEKINRVLDAWLPTVNATRQEAEYFCDSDSEQY